MAGVTLHTPRDQALSGGLSCFEVAGVKPEEVAKRLADKRIRTSSSPYKVSYARVAAGIMNVPDEIERVTVASALPPEETVTAHIFLDQADASRRVIDSRLGQRVGHDHTRPVDAEMELLPASLAATAVLRRGPFTFAPNREARAIDDEMNRPLGRDAAHSTSRCRLR